MLPKTEKARGLCALYFLSFSYATFGVFARLLSADLEVFQQIASRTAAAFILCFAIFPGALNVEAIRRVPRRDWFILVLRCLVFYILGIACYTPAVLYTSLGNVAFISALPVLAVWGVLLFGEKLSWAKTALVALSLCGVGLICLRNFPRGLEFGKGEMFALVAAVFFNLGVITRRWHSPGLTDQFLTHAMTFIGFWICVGMSLVVGEPVRYVFSWESAAVIALSGGLICANAFLSNYGVARVEGIIAGNILTLECVFGVLLGYLIYREIPQARAFAGGSLIVGSVLLMNYLEARRGKKLISA